MREGGRKGRREEGEGEGGRGRRERGREEGEGEGGRGRREDGERGKESRVHERVIIHSP